MKKTKQKKTGSISGLAKLFDYQIVAKEGF